MNSGEREPKIVKTDKERPSHRSWPFGYKPGRRYVSELKPPPTGPALGPNLKDPQPPRR